MIWDQLREHEEQVAMLQRSLQRNRLAHAFLFVGPPGIGKRKFAQLFAQCLLCPETPADVLDACGQCSSCRQMQAGTHPDFLSVGLPPGKSELPIDVFVGPPERRGREGLCHDIALRPMAGDRKVAMIDDAELMNAESANALLKTLEEPPAYSLMILLATDPDALLPTIRSRCQQVRFAALKPSTVAELLVEQELVQDPADAGPVAELSGGSLEIARQLLDPALRKLRDALYDGLAADRYRGRSIAAKMLEGIEAVGGEARDQRAAAAWVVRFATEFFRLAGRAIAGGEAPAGIPQVARFAARFPNAPESIELMADLVDRAALAETQLDRRITTALCLETLFADLGRQLRPVSAA